MEQERSNQQIKIHLKSGAWNKALIFTLSCDQVVL